jgi:hypothetical protein
MITQLSATGGRERRHRGALRRPRLFLASTRISTEVYATLLESCGALIYKISSLRERVVTELLYETAMNRRESRRQVCCTVIMALITIITLSGCPRNGLSVPRSQTAPRNASPVPRNRSDVPRNAKIVPGNTLAPGNDPTVPGNAGTVPGNAENQNEQVSFSYSG